MKTHSALKLRPGSVQWVPCGALLEEIQGMKEREFGENRGAKISRADP